jgi:hypothetical protein
VGDNTVSDKLLAVIDVVLPIWLVITLWRKVCSFTYSNYHYTWYLMHFVVYFMLQVLLCLFDVGSWATY